MPTWNKVVFDIRKNPLNSFDYFHCTPIDWGTDKKFLKSGQKTSKVPSAQPNDSVIIWNMKSYQTNNPKETQALAEQLAKLVYPGLVVTLQGDLGAGKTTFTQGLAKALGITSRVKSPTFNILNTYEEGRIPLYHFDAYRLENMGAADQGFEDYLGTDGVTLIEWPQYMADLLPNDRLEMTFTRMAGADSDREIVVRGLGQAAQIEEDLHG